MELAGVSSDTFYHLVVIRAGIGAVYTVRFRKPFARAGKDSEPVGDGAVLRRRRL